MWSNVLLATDLFMETMAGISDQINIRAHDILRASRFSDLFLTLALTGSLSTAFTILFIGCFVPSAKAIH